MTYNAHSGRESSKIYQDLQACRQRSDSPGSMDSSTLKSTKVSYRMVVFSDIVRLTNHENTCAREVLLVVCYFNCTTSEHFLSRVSNYLPHMLITPIFKAACQRSQSA
jgi:hypothetical protein